MALVKKVIDYYYGDWFRYDQQRSAIAAKVFNIAAVVVDQLKTSLSTVKYFGKSTELTELEF